MRLLESQVRFGDTSLGPTMHSTRFFDLLAIALEELGAALDYPFAEILEADGTPYAPVDVRASISRYPAHGERVVVDGTPVEIGTRSFTMVYTFSRDSDGRENGRIRTTHVTIDADGEAEPLPEHVRDGLTAMGGEDPSQNPVDYPDISEIRRDDATFSRDVRIRTPHVEAADLGYFEEYFRFVSIALEEFFEERGIPIETACGAAGQLQPVGWQVSFEDVVPFGADLTVAGTVEQTGAGGFTVQYRIDGNVEPNIRCAFAYRCVGPDGEPTAVPAAIGDALSTGESD